MKKRISLSLKIADNFFKKLVGFSFKFKKIEHALLIKNCNSIHTFFMFQKIDVIMTDSCNKVLYIKANVSPLKIILPKNKCVHTYELPNNSIKKHNIVLGDIITFKSL